MKKIIISIIFCLLLNSCKKINYNNESIIITGNEKNQLIEKNIDKIEMDQSIFDKYSYQYSEIVLFSKNIIVKEKSMNQNNSEVKNDGDEIYNVKYIDLKNNTVKIIISDKFQNSWLLPIILDDVIMKQKNDESTIKTTGYRCFILHRLDGITYQLFYINEFNKDTNKLGEINIEVYLYKTIWTPGDGFKILITPNYFIVRHWDIGGEDWILINRVTKKYKILDSSEEKEKH